MIYQTANSKTHVDVTALRGAIADEEFDYRTLMHVLRGYASPRGRITTLLQRGTIMRVKKGIYVFDPRLRHRPVSREHLSNLLYGPSYISREYALGFHGLLPEQVSVVTAVTTGGSRRFHTPLGVFTYDALSDAAYAVGYSLVDQAPHTVLMASPEKALADLVHFQRGLRLRSQRDVEQLLFDDLRIDEDALMQFDTMLMTDIEQHAASQRVRVLMRTLLRWHGEAVDNA